MHIHARVQNQRDSHRVMLSTDGYSHALEIPSKSSGFGSSLNGGELLFLALATCYCNDVYREAAKAGIKVDRVDVDVEGEFGGIGEPARNVSYRMQVMVTGGNEAEVKELLRHTDSVSEIQNTLRAGVSVQLSAIEVEITT